MNRQYEPTDEQKREFIEKITKAIEEKVMNDHTIGIMVSFNPIFNDTEIKEGFEHFLKPNHTGDKIEIEFRYY